MKAHRILIFILSVIALLAVLCSFFPTEGIEVGGMSLHFPSIGDIVYGSGEEEAEDPALVIERRQAAMREARKNDLIAYFESDPARIHLPGGDLTYLDPFFAALEKAGQEHLRILHYGDSQIEEDRISKVLRDSLQTRFGGGGPGLMPVRDKYYTLSFAESSSSTPQRYLVYGPAEMRGAGGRYGVMGEMCHFDSTATTTLYPIKSNDAPSRWFNRLTLLSSGGGTYIQCRGQKVAVEPSQDIVSTTFTLPDSTSRVSFTHSGYRDIYGVMLDSDTGVSLDNIPMRGCAGTIFSSISSSQLGSFFSEQNVRLIILQYGGNVVPYTKTEKAISQYCEGISRQIRLLRGLAPDARILFIGPSDMSTSVQGKMQTYPHLPGLVESLKAACLESGAAFWDMYSAMGGEGSMKKWVTSQPPLAGSDYVHFTPLGAKTIGEMCYESLMLYFDYYQLQKAR